MEDFFLKAFELGGLAGVTFYLLIKGTAAIKELSDSNRVLSESVKALAEEVKQMDNRVTRFEDRVETRLEALERSVGV